MVISQLSVNVDYLAALINDSAGVIATNTAAIQLAHAREKPSVALFSSDDKAKVFVPNPEEKKCAIISSKTGKLIDIDIEAVRLQPDPFLNELTSMFERTTEKGSVWVTLKHSSDKSKVQRNKMKTAGEKVEFRCLIRATDGKKTISTLV
ncbi:hypothetical protein RD792_005717 [Penstemon davidsonii]|uniref:Uncharacterized protein n=1 Tax=Penstemon davidsonii TaxID=160366 RepID=A0ABR0DEF4_9LAMI|nr:hypothetical protein RD792_005717 [Penstemon davidsonii]